MENIIDREVAWRIFAFEFNRSNLYHSEGDERAPNYIITPTGVRCNRLFVVGVVTEVENIGAENNLWRARIATRQACSQCTQDSTSLKLLFSYPS